MSSGALQPFDLAPATARELTRRAAAAAPREACGLLLAGASEAVEIVELDNHATRPTLEFTLDPGAVVAAHARAEARGSEVVATWHTHPVGPAEPSERDLELARDWPRLVHLVVTPGGDVAGWSAAGQVHVASA